MHNVGEITDETENSDFKTLEKQKLVRRAVYGVLSAKITEISTVQS